jgi:hypothetical protein
MRFDELKSKMERIAPGVLFDPDNLVTDQDGETSVVKLPGKRGFKLVSPYRDGNSDPLVDDQEARVLIEWATLKMANARPKSHGAPPTS